jgi:hypothetical protein
VGERIGQEEVLVAMDAAQKTKEADRTKGANPNRGWARAQVSEARPRYTAVTRATRNARSGGHAPWTCRHESRAIVDVVDGHKQWCASQVWVGARPMVMRSTWAGASDGEQSRVGFLASAGVIRRVVPAPHTSVLVMMSWRVDGVSLDELLG